MESQAMFKPIEVKPLPGYRLWLRYTDGTSGEVDLSDFVGKGVFALWNDRSAFEQVRIGEHGEVVWSDQVDLCPDALYLQLTGKTPEDVFPNLNEMKVNA
jgi:hypothetical protein